MNDGLGFLQDQANPIWDISTYASQPLPSFQTLHADLQVVRILKALLKLFRTQTVDVPRSPYKAAMQKCSLTSCSPYSKLSTQIPCNKRQNVHL